MILAMLSIRFYRGLLKTMEIDNIKLTAFTKALCSVSKVVHFFVARALERRAW